MSERLRILFVDDERNILDGLRRQLYVLREEWQPSFCSSGSEALALLEQQPFDILVSDMRMPGMDGAELLDQVRKRWPEMLRFALSGQSEQEIGMRTIGPAQQYLSKPCNLDTLKRAVNKSWRLHQELRDPALRILMNRLPNLSTLPEPYLRLMAEFCLPEPETARLAAAIEEDSALSAKVLQLVNAAGFPRPITSLTEALPLVGIPTVRSIALAVHLFDRSPVMTSTGFSGEWLWQHALGIAQGARTLALAMRCSPALVNTCFIAGLLHDTGLLVLAAHVGEESAAIMQDVRTRGGLLIEAERRRIGVSHEAIGAHLLASWGLPDNLVEAVAFHHDPGRAASTTVITPLTILHLADALDPNPEPGINAVINEAWAATRGFTPHLAEWRELLAERTPSIQGQ